MNTQYIDQLRSHFATYCFTLHLGIIGYKILHRILREKFLELAVELRRQRLIVRNDQSRFIELCNDICHGKSLAGAGNT